MSQLLLHGEFFAWAFRNIIFLLDKIVYSIAKTAYVVFCYVSQATLLDGTMIENLTRRVYAIVGLVMIFVLAYNLLNYIIDPDKMTDKKNGAGAILKDVIIALVIITFTPVLFTKLYAFQNTVIMDGVISNLILGGYTSGDGSTTDNLADLTEQDKARKYIEQGAGEMAANVFAAFVMPTNPTVENFTVLNCNDGKTKMDAYSPEASYCDAYETSVETGNLDAFGDIINQDSDYTYLLVFSTAAGIVMLFFMASFCINLGKRVGKMAILQLIAPIPALMEIIPGKSGTRKTWIDTLVKTYLEVFVYQAIVFIIMYFITLVPRAIGNLFSNGGSFLSDPLVKMLTLVAIIFGLLQFAKEAPKMLMDLLGIKESGTIKEVAQRAVRMAGSVTSGFGVGATSLVRGGIDTVGRFRNDGARAGFRAAGSTLISGITGVGRGMYVNRSGGFKGIVGRTSTAVNQNMANKGEFATNMSNRLGDMRDSVSSWATGRASGFESPELKAYNSFTSDVWSGMKVSHTTDAQWLKYQEDINKLNVQKAGMSAENISSEFDLKRDQLRNAFRSTYYNPDGSAARPQYEIDEAERTLNSQLNSLDLEERSQLAEIESLDKQIADLETAQKARRDYLRTTDSEKNKIAKSVATAKARLKSSSDLRNVDPALASDVMSINLTDDASYLAAYETMKKFEDALEAKDTAKRVELTERESRRKKPDSSSK